MYIDERLLKILETHKGETIDVDFMISLIKTISKEHETEQLHIGGVSKSFYCDNTEEEGMLQCGDQCDFCKKNRFNND